MNIFGSAPILLGILAVMIFLPGVQAQFQEQYATPPSAYSTASSQVTRSSLQFSQFYTMMPETSPRNAISAPQPFQIAANMPSIVYLGEQMQTVPFSQYMFDPGQRGSNSLWIAGETAWTQYAVVPQGSTVSLYAISPTGGTGSLDYVDSNGQTHKHDYMFYPSSQFTFHADMIGRHVLSFSLNGQASNQVVIDVASPYAQQSGYRDRYPSYYPWSYYPSGYPDYYWDYYPDYFVKSKPHDEDHGPRDGDRRDKGGDDRDNKAGDKGKDDRGDKGKDNDGRDRGADDKKGGGDGHDKGWDPSKDDKDSDKGSDHNGKDKGGDDKRGDIGKDNEAGGKARDGKGGDKGRNNSGADIGRHDRDTGTNWDRDHGETGGNQGGGNGVECGPGHHLENGNGVADQGNTVEGT